MSRSRFETQTPWLPHRYNPLRESVWQFLATATLVFGGWYIVWRWSASINFNAWWFGVPLVSAETLGYFGLVLFVFSLWTSKAPARGDVPATAGDCLVEPDDAQRPLAVDVFFATYDEDPELVRLGLRDAKRISYPYPIDLRIHVLDDGKRPEMEAVARDEHVEYITRSDNAGFKAGNLRNAMSVTSGDFFLICDADTRPFPTILTEVMGYFRDPSVAWVQTPQWFNDIPPGVPLPSALERRFGRAGKAFGRLIERLFGRVRLGEDPFANDPETFFDFIQRSRNWANASFCCGAASIHRREAVMEAALRQWSDQVSAAAGRNTRAARRITGEAAVDSSVTQLLLWQGALDVELTPYKFHVSEDIYTSIALHSDRERGWKSIYHPVVLSKMLSPNDLLSWTIQRFKYAGGTLDILFSDNPLFRKGLTLRQKLMYAATFYSYLSPIWNLVFFISPIIFLFTGIAPISTYSLDFFIHIGPFLILNELSQLVGLWGEQNYKNRSWYLARFAINLKALWTVIRRRKVSFPVTPKDRQEGTYPRLVRWHILIVVVTLIAMAWGAVGFVNGRPGYTLGAMIANVLWGLSNIFSLLPIIRSAFWRPDPNYDVPILEKARAA
jgi:cellulose synthase (UDP-forming)